MADSRETQFQQDIINQMVASGWLTGPASGYDRTTALYTEDLLTFVQEAYPGRWQKFCKNNPQDPAGALIKAVVRELEQHGTLEVLRHGFKVPGVKIDLCSFRPDHGMNPEAQARYVANRLRVVQEVSYSPHAREGEYNPRLDLVLFVNGIPTATLELKSQFKQSVENAKRQYRYDRPPKDPVTRKPEPLLTFKRGALVHFAVSQAEVAMTTRLDGKATYFLPFNRGTQEGGAGNPPAPDADTYATAYLWQQVFEKDAWLSVLGRFLHLDRQEIQHFDGTKDIKEALIFPRYHQWQVVNRLIDATREEGAGHKYLIQHSAGSGKSNSIAWLAHQLASLYDSSGASKLFNSVVVVTDRTVLDSQLQNTIYQFEHAQGVVRPITRDIGNQSKSEQLAEALASQTRIIIVTIQTFPALFDALDKHPELASGRYAVIADEAHSSQTGSSATKLKAILGADRPEGDEISAEELLDAAVQSRKPSESISYYAFTATPKAKTLELFGRPPDPNLPPGKDNLPEPFHLYSMRQAIEEGFILDVLKRYITYNTAWKLSHPHGDDTEVESRKASTALARWVRLHPYNISQRVEIIVEHFREHVRHLLDGQAKAMVVTGSRQEAVRYALAMRQYVEANGYKNVHPLVAFSGTVPADEVTPEEVSETSSLLNPGLKGRDLADAFDTADYNVMIAANKYQTGFDQPKLCAMYVDKKLQGVDCVQTLSRLNRTFPGKETFILDFFNDPQDILEAFVPYYGKAELEDVSDSQIVYDIQKGLDEQGIYHWEEVVGFAIAFFNPGAPASKLSFYCQPSVGRFNARYKAVLEDMRLGKQAQATAEKAGDREGIKRAEGELEAAGKARDGLELFRKNLQSFVRAYEFLSQIVHYDDAELEQLCVFAKHLYPLLRIDRLDEETVDVSELALTHYRLTKRAEHELRVADEEGDYGLKPLTEVGTGKPYDPEKERLSEIINRLNDLFGAEVGDDDKLHFANGIADRIERDEEVMAQIRHHSTEKIMHGLFPKRVTDAVLDALGDHGKLSEPILENKNVSNDFALTILKIIALRGALENY
ncbi:DEAD/DEAH box helicase family protein [Haliea sp.]|jgi:type I restriction enzyme R subunit|uniref:type I restriction endonuclease subunit R n=1 Tax=Haliea TaxID=475794 RepID=UPI000C608C4C|nr:DEAD/DEAH box helicase family protein [Haliea sp.]HCD56559.1 restriction endonuclease subunit R [Halieaceae bacterium]MAD65179.1 restriction endonuclease subunit R [Haliea sp.]MAY92941.1 restriction endonuclease subunit R [Haliea sp.]MBK40428.1 restriction endonuclease subunit R [Haliea sp.]MBP68821.1 restriction endonuclease subunit R [Haliea sp.]|tara:strand:- start:10224 stop:13394 length:3171 start_codon:yes stop_codon:yes gene_type:complete